MATSLPSPGGAPEAAGSSATAGGASAAAGTAGVAVLAGEAALDRARAAGTHTKTASEELLDTGRHHEHRPDPADTPIQGPEITPPTDHPGGQS